MEIKQEEILLETDKLFGAREFIALKNGEMIAIRRSQIKMAISKGCVVTRLEIKDQTMIYPEIEFLARKPEWHEEKGMEYDYWCPN